MQTRHVGPTGLHGGTLTFKLLIKFRTDTADDLLGGSDLVDSSNDSNAILFKCCFLVNPYGCYYLHFFIG